MKSKILSLLIIPLAFFTFHAQAQDLEADKAEELRLCLKGGGRTPVPVINHDNIAVSTGSGKTISPQQVKQAITEAAADKNWSLVQQSNGTLLATLNVRGKHSVMVDINYTASQFSLLYKSSSNMNYAFCQGKAYIHPFYNKWVSNLKTTIQAKLQRY